MKLRKLLTLLKRSFRSLNNEQKLRLLKVFAQIGRLDRFEWLLTEIDRKYICNDKHKVDIDFIEGAAGQIHCTSSVHSLIYDAYIGANLEIIKLVQDFRLGADNRSKIVALASGFTRFLSNPIDVFVVARTIEIKKEKEVELSDR